MKIAAAQYSGGILDLELSVNRLLEGLTAAADVGASLVVFPETFLGGYPYWRGNVSVARETELGARLYENSVTPDDECLSEIASEAKRLGLSVVAGANEADARTGSKTIYNSALLFHPEKGYVGSHRKLIPTHTERAYWAQGGVEDIVTFETPVGEVGVLICYKHHMLASQLAMSLLGEEVHCALWPGYWETLSHIADKRPGKGDTNVEIDAVVRAYAMHTQNFVVSANAILRDGDIPEELRAELGYNLARGGSSVVDPSGRYLAEPQLDEEGIVSATIDHRSRLTTKSYLDTVGHYSRWDVFEFFLGGRSLTGPTQRGGAHRRDDELRREESVDGLKDGAGSGRKLPGPFGSGALEAPLTTSKEQGDT